MWRWPGPVYAPLIDGGGGGGSSRTRGADGIEEEICKRLGFPYYGFLLYHSGNKRLQRFLDKSLTYLDRVIGNDIGIFILYKRHKYPLKIDEIVKRGNLDKQTKEMIDKWRERGAAFTENMSFEIAESLGLSRSHLPCLVLYRTSSSDYKSFALLRLKDSWFSKDAEDEESMNKTMEWLARLFDSLSESMKIEDRQSAIKDFQDRMDSLARNMNVIRPILKGLKAGVMPIINFPLELIAVLPTILEKVAIKKLGVTEEAQGGKD
jgi:hypothetical protein